MTTNNSKRRKSLQLLKAAKRTILTKSENDKYRYRGDRFMAHRAVMNFNDLENRADQSDDNITHNIFSVPNLINETMMPSKKQILKLRLSDMSPSTDEKLKRFLEANRNNKASLNRQISFHPERVLDAPDVSNEYPNIMDWGQNNTVAVALKETVYLWEAVLGIVHELIRFNEESSELVSCIKWLRHSSYNSDDILAIGTTFGSIIIYDVKEGYMIRQLQSSNRSPITSIVMRRNILSVGLESGQLEHHDVNLSTSLILINNHHNSVIHHLKWSSNMQNLATVANSTGLSVWSANNLCATSVSPLVTIREKISDVVWSPREPNVLLYCSSVIDRRGTGLLGTLQLFDVSTKTCLHKVIISSPARRLFWSELCTEIAVALDDDFGNCCIRLVHETNLQLLTELIGHRGTIATMVSNPVGDVIATIGHDEQIRLWNCFKSPDTRKNRPGASSSSSEPSMLDTLARFR